MNVILFWDKHDFQSDQEVQKNLKTLYHTCLSYNVDLEVIDEKRELQKMNIGFPFPIHDYFLKAPMNNRLYLFEPRNVTQGKYQSIDLRDVHPHEDTTLVFGSNFMTLTPSICPGGKFVHIPTLNERPLWQDVALGVVLHHMRFSNGRSY